MSTRHATLTVRDTSGAPISIPTGAVRAPAGPALAVNGSAANIAGVPVGQPIQIHVPGYAPTCRVSPTGDAVLTVTLERGRTVYVAGEDLSGFYSAEIGGLQDADCRVNVSSLRPHWDTDRTKLLIDDFPASGSQTLVIGTVTRQITIAPDGRISLK